MDKVIQGVDRLAVWLARGVIKHRYLMIIGSIIAVLLVASGAKQLGMATDYRVFFSGANPDLVAFENFQNTYTKNDNFLFVLQPKDGQLFSPKMAAILEDITEQAWSIPYALRVDSISNFQYSWADGDELTVEDLIKNGADLSLGQLRDKKQIALNDPILKDNLITERADTTGINVTLQYPQKSIDEVPKAAAVARAIAAELTAAHPDIKVALSGISMMNNSFSESGIKDMKTLVPIMYGVIILLMLLIYRSVSATVATLLVVIFSMMVSVGAGGWLKVLLTPVSFAAPTIVLTLAIADSVHILVSLREFLLQGMQKAEAIVEAVRINFLAVSITSVTTIVGFLALNFSDSPPFGHLGNMTAAGIAGAWFLSVCFLPAILSVLPMKVKPRSQAMQRQDIFERLADWVILHSGKLLIGMGVLAVGLSFMATKNELNDAWTKYFDESIEFRRDSDFATEHLGGLYPIEFSIEAQGAGGINDPSYLRKVDEFVQWLRAQPDVTHVFSVTDIIKRLNKNMHGDDPNYYRLPEDQNLSAQYLLVYELSLPQGLDLNDRINIDKSAMRVTATMGDVTTVRTRELIEQSEVWLRNNAPAHMHTQATGATQMFSYIAERNILSMLKGNVIALGAIALIMMLALRSVWLGAFSLIPNAVPILVAFGVWGLTVGMVGMAAATIAASSLGIIVDDTVHLLTKYLRGRRERGLDIPNAIRYSFKMVGKAITVNTVILTLGFGVLTLSSFKINKEMGMLTMLAVVSALVIDFLLLPALLMLAHRFKKNTSDPSTANPSQGASHATS